MPLEKIPVTTEPVLTRPDRLIQQIIAYRTSQCIHAVAELGIPALLERGPQTAVELAQGAGAQADLLARVLDNLVNEGVFARDAGGRYLHTEASRFLVPGHAQSLHHWVACELHPGYWRAWEGIVEQLRTGATAFDLGHGKPFFQWLAQDPAARKRFDDSMRGASLEMGRAVARQMTFAAGKTIVDVGGGDGSFLAQLLLNNPDTKGILFELPRSVEAFNPQFEALLASGRANVQSGSFLESIPSGGDAYVFSRVFHDFDDRIVAQVLRNVRAVMRGDESLFVVDMMMDRAKPRQRGASLDIVMMVLLGGRERTGEEFSALLADNGFVAMSLSSTDSPLCILEARCAGE